MRRLTIPRLRVPCWACRGTKVYQLARPIGPYVSCPWCSATGRMGPLEWMSSRQLHRRSGGTR